MSDERGHQLAPLVDGGFRSTAFQQAGNFGPTAEVTDSIFGVHASGSYSMLNSEIKDAVRSVTYAGRHMETMGDRIKLLREARRLTQEGLAKRVGVSKSAVSQWEDGSTKNIKLQTFLCLVEELRTDAPYLIFGPDRAPAGTQPGKAAWRSR